MKTIELTKGYFAKVDDEDYDRLNTYKWRLSINGNKMYGVTSIGRYCQYLHREVLSKVEGDGLIIDHINGDGLDNQKINLRLVSKSTNLRNTGVDKRSTTGYKGVSHFQGRFRAYVFVKGKQKSLGLFDTALEAAERYNKASKFYFGADAYQNPL